MCIMNNYPKVTIVYLSYYAKAYVDDVIGALKKITYPKDRIDFVIVDNPRAEYGSLAPYLEEVFRPLSGKEIPEVTILAQTENLGFAGGNNVGAAWGIAHGADYIFFHNDDGFMAADGLERLVEVMENDRTIGMAQSLMLLYPETAYVNSSGNSFHYLGFGFCNNYRTPVADIGGPIVENISYASGAACLVSRSLIQKFGMWDHDFTMYHEDLEWSFRLRIAGYRVVVVKNSLFYHKYQFSRSIQKFYLMQRNRYGVMLMFFRLPTLLLLLPMALVLEVGLWFFAWKNKWLDKQFAIYVYWLQYKHWKLWLKKRRYIQSIRTIPDRELFRNASSTIEFQEKMMQNPLLTYVGNPIMKWYYNIVIKIFLRW